ncbi:MAG TPA: hypothetical protein VNJ09_11365, partial [Chthonomonadales bacterium]|nr:hypothetical protein [Chthonomonadales bacterium]
RTPQGDRSTEGTAADAVLMEEVQREIFSPMEGEAPVRIGWKCWSQLFGMILYIMLQSLSLFFTANTLQERVTSQ